MPYGAYSDSDSDTDTESGGDRVSSEAKLLNDLDLSSREETVQYKPNPFSIAKINAASRPAAIKADMTKAIPALKPAAGFVAPPRRDKPRLKPKNLAGSKSNGNIIDGFKKQTKRVPVNAGTKSLKPSSTIPKRHVPTPPVAVSRAGAITPASVTWSKNMTRPFRPLVSRPRVDENAAMTQLTPSAANKELLTLNMSTQALQASEIAPSIRTQSLMSAHITSPKSPLLHQMSPFLDSRQSGGSRATYHAHALPFSSPPRQLARTSDFSQSNTSDLAAGSSPMKPSQSTATRDFVFNTRTWADTSSSRFSRESRQSVQRAPAFAHCVPPRLGPPMRENPLRQKAHLPVHDVDLYPSRSQSPVPAFPILNPKSRPSTPADMPYYELNEAYMPSPSTPATYNIDTEYDSFRKFPAPQDLPRQTYKQHVYLPEPASIEFYPPSKRTSESPSPSPPESKSSWRTPSRPSDSKKRDAYAFFAPDSEETWSTLPARKKTKMTGSASVQRTGKFRVQKLGLAPANTITAKTGMSATSARRVITFLPPPLQSKSKSKPVEGFPAEEAGTGRRAYPSPTRSVLESSSSPLPRPRSRMSSPSLAVSKTNAGEKDSYTPLSPPPSDLPVPQTEDHDHGRDMRMEVNLDMIGRLYPGMKAAWRKVRDDDSVVKMTMRQGW
ncbi:hypothetical protein D9615_004845 [Tricholomella constricta]|uniref:Uncharacterized protein n=1 Tax=Tricholomella constricta TaxID=117010 RepID=A0A8H5HHD4_9AGAR|nr:hypothetical protein D9615_004845 [Tricholomella constricta]